jgi:hypothetical protein
MSVVAGVRYDDVSSGRVSAIKHCRGTDAQVVSVRVDAVFEREQNGNLSLNLPMDISLAGLEPEFRIKIGARTLTAKIDGRNVATFREHVNSLVIPRGSRSVPKYGTGSYHAYPVLPRSNGGGRKNERRQRLNSFDAIGGLLL